MRIFCFIITFALHFGVSAQDHSGIWFSNLLVGSTAIPLELQLDPGCKTGKMYSRSQTSRPMVLTDLVVEKDHMQWKAWNGQISFEGHYDGEAKWIGKVTQGGVEMELYWVRDVNQIQQTERVPNRPQTPKPPFLYRSLEKKFVSKDNNGKEIILSGTLTLPAGDGPFPCLVMVTGSGPQDRNESLMNHQPFWVIADYLARNGWATYRYDDRGVGYSEGEFRQATSYDLMTDAMAAVDQMRKEEQLDSKRIGLLGHSEGGMIGAMVAARDTNLYCLASLAGPGVDGGRILIQQVFDIGVAGGQRVESAAQDSAFMSSIVHLIRTETDSALIAEGIKQKVVLENVDPKENDGKYEGMEIVDQYNNSMNTPWMRYFVNYPIERDWQQVRCYTLALNGDKDMQVNSTINLNAISTGMSKHQNKLTKVELADHNHLFQYTETGSTAEYSTLEETFSPDALKILLDWLNKLP